MSTQWQITDPSYFNFGALPHNVIARIAGPFYPPDLINASLVCLAWGKVLKPLREAVIFLETGKILKRERKRMIGILDEALGKKMNGILGEALEDFLKGAERGSTRAMVEVGLVYSEMGRKDEGILLFRKAAELGDPEGQYNLAMSYLEANTPNTKVAIEYLYKASAAEIVRAKYQLGLCLQRANPPNMKEAFEYFYKAAANCYSPAEYQLALCYHQGRGVEPSLEDAAMWYVRAGVGGHMRAMFNASLCYLRGEGVPRSDSLATIWSEKALEYMQKHRYSNRHMTELKQRRIDGRYYMH